MRALGFEHTKDEVLKILADLHPTNNANSNSSKSNPALNPKTLLTQAISFEEFMRLMSQKYHKEIPLRKYGGHFDCLTLIALAV